MSLNYLYSIVDAIIVDQKLLVADKKLGVQLFVLE